MMNSNRAVPFHLYALHGFLGLPTDWSMFEPINHPIEIKDSELDFWAWSRNFNSSIKKKGKNILLGYSLGGRLAMHALISNPTLWDGAIFISAHPGLSSEAEQAARQKNDQQWAERFLAEPWGKLMHDWNANPVFGERAFPFPREEKQFDRKKLAQQLVNWSLGKQEALLPQLRKSPTPMLILAGELDLKFRHLADQFREFAKVSIIPQAVHRVPWDQPKKFTEEIIKFMEDIS